MAVCDDMPYFAFPFSNATKSAHVLTTVYVIMHMMFAYHFHAAVANFIVQLVRPRRPVLNDQAWMLGACHVRDVRVIYV